MDCVFCNLKRFEILESNEHALTFRDGYPIVEFHTLVIPRRHAATYFELEHYERQSIHELLISQREKILAQDNTVEGFNIGWNCGEVSGQTVFHAHQHLIPRRRGDIENPRGGIRHLFPEKANYEPLMHPWISKRHHREFLNEMLGHDEPKK